MKFLKYFFFLLPCFGTLLAEDAIIEKKEQIDDRHAFFTLSDQRKFFSYITSDYLREGDRVEIKKRNGGEFQLIRDYSSAYGFFCSVVEKEIMYITEDDEFYLKDGMLLDIWGDNPGFKENDRIFQIQDLSQPNPNIGERTFFLFGDKVIKAFLEAVIELDRPDVTVVHSFPVKLDVTEIDKEDGIDEKTVADATWYIVHLSGGELILSQNELDPNESFCISVDDSCYHLSNQERKKWYEGPCPFTLQTEKVTRTVASVEEHQVIFDDGFILPRAAAEGELMKKELLPLNGTFEIKSFDPLEIEIDFEETKIACDAISGLHITIDHVDGESSVHLELRSSEEFVQFCGLKPFQVGEVYDCYHLSEVSKNNLRKLILDRIPQAEDIGDKICVFYRRG